MAENNDKANETNWKLQLPGIKSTSLMTTLPHIKRERVMERQREREKAALYIILCLIILLTK